MKTKVKLLILFISLAVTLSLMSNTYSKYVADTTGNLEVQFAKWKILVNQNDITNNSESSIELTPVIDSNENVAANKFAPSSKGYFDIEIDPTNVEVSFDYIVELELLNENLPDLLISNYSIIDGEYDGETTLKLNDIIDNKITGTLKYKKVSTGSDDVFTFKPFTIRVYFEWFDGENSTMSDDVDTLVGTSTDITSLQIRANIKFEQNINAINDLIDGKVVTPSE